MQVFAVSNKCSHLGLPLVGKTAMFQAQARRGYDVAVRRMWCLWLWGARDLRDATKANSGCWIPEQHGDDMGAVSTTNCRSRTSALCARHTARTST